MLELLKDHTDSLVITRFPDINVVLKHGPKEMAYGAGNSVEEAVSDLKIKIKRNEAIEAEHKAKLAALTLEQIASKFHRNSELLKQMVGTLYPSIVQKEQNELAAEYLKRTGVDLYVVKDCA